MYCIFVTVRETAIDPVQMRPENIHPMKLGFRQTVKFIMLKASVTGYMMTHYELRSLKLSRAINVFRADQTLLSDLQ